MRCTKCNSSFTKETTGKTREGHPIKILYCHKCQTEIKRTLITTS